MVSVFDLVEGVCVGDDLGEFVGGEEEGACVDVWALGVSAEGEGGYDAEVLWVKMVRMERGRKGGKCSTYLAGAADGPEEVFV